MVIESFDPSQARTIREMVYETLKRAIFEEELKHGDRLVEKELAQRMRVSRTPVREAIRKLEMEGLVKHIPRKGVVVQGITFNDVIEIFAIREALEVATVSFIINNITEDEIRKLYQIIERINKLLDDDDQEELFKTSRHFNEVLLKSSRMPRLINLISTYQEYLEKFRKVTLSKKTRKKCAIREHEEILKAINQRNVPHAEKLVKNHLGNAREECLITFKNKEKNIRQNYDKKGCECIG